MAKDSYTRLCDALALIHWELIGLVDDNNPDRDEHAQRRANVDKAWKTIVTTLMESRFLEEVHKGKEVR